MLQLLVLMLQVSPHTSGTRYSSQTTASSSCLQLMSTECIRAATAALAAVSRVVEVVLLVARKALSSSSIPGKLGCTQLHHHQHRSSTAKEHNPNTAAQSTNKHLLLLLQQQQQHPCNVTTAEVPAAGLFLQAVCLTLQGTAQATPSGHQLALKLPLVL
jgi:hypothetical protein